MFPLYHQSSLQIYENILALQALPLAPFPLHTCPASEEVQIGAVVKSLLPNWPPELQPAVTLVIFYPQLVCSHHWHVANSNIFQLQKQIFRYLDIITNLCFSPFVSKKWSKWVDNSGALRHRGRINTYKMCYYDFIYVGFGLFKGLCVDEKKCRAPSASSCAVWFCKSKRLF